MEMSEKSLPIRKYGSCYLVAAVSVLGMKWYYSSADCEALRWILAPTAWWVSILSGMPFAYEPRIGYVSHSLRFIIAPSCSGMQFMMIVFAVLAGAFVHRMGTRGRGFCWLAGCAAASVLLTVFVNGLRIALAIWVPGLVFGSGTAKGWINPEQLHTVLGVIVYFSSLMAVYCGAGSVFSPPGERAQKRAGWMIPAAVYGMVVLGLPLLNGALEDNREQFTGYAALVALVCALILCLFRGTGGLYHFIRRRCMDSPVLEKITASGGDNDGCRKISRGDLKACRGKRECKGTDPLLHPSQVCAKGRVKGGEGGD